MNPRHTCRMKAEAGTSGGGLEPGCNSDLTEQTLTHQDLDALEADLRGDNYTTEVGLTLRYGSDLHTSQRYKTTLHVQLRLNSAVRGRIGVRSYSPSVPCCAGLLERIS